jgi:hypothetical protein
MANKKKQIGIQFGTSGPYGAANVYGAGNFYRNGGKVDKKELAMKLLPMLMGMPSMSEGGFIDQSDDIAKLSALISTYGPVEAVEVGNPFAGVKNEKDKEDKKDLPKKCANGTCGHPEHKGNKKTLLPEDVKTYETDPNQRQEMVGDKGFFVGEELKGVESDPGFFEGNLTSTYDEGFFKREGGLVALYDDLPQYEYGGLPVEGETNAEARERQGRQSVAGQTLGGVGSGAATGAAIGSVAGLPGSIVGGAIGGLVGGVGGFFKGKRDKREAEEYDDQMVAAQNKRDAAAAQAEREDQARSEYASYQDAQQQAMLGAEAGIDQTGYGVDIMRQGGLTGMPQFEAEGGEVYQGKGLQQVYGQGELKQNSTDSMKIEGPQHEQGGVKMESTESGRIFSDKLKPKGEKSSFAELADTYTKELGKIEERAEGQGGPAQTTAKYMKQDIESKLDALFQTQEDQKQAKELRKAKREEKKMREGGMLPEYSTGGLAAASFAPQLISPLYNIGKGMFSNLEYAKAEEVEGVDYSKMIGAQQDAKADMAAAYARLGEKAGKYETYNPAAELAVAREAAGRTRYDLQGASGGSLRKFMQGLMAAQRAQTGMEGSVLGKKAQMDTAARDVARQRQVAIGSQAAQGMYGAQSVLAQMMGQQAQADQAAAAYNAQVREKNQLYRLQAKAARDSYLDQGMSQLGANISGGLESFYFGQALQD